ncbi:MAG: GntR family transcriptional regulator [Lachnospiraceae bacterium]|nr:GntR family transcriptional regulator [Lachnospiraceae bacterium]MBR7046543.1 GntR family transcriptional regulator [Lachnospiraceae bacterium]
MHIILNNSSMVPIYEQLMDQVKNAIINGELSENEALPSVRALSGKLRISALTVKKAYDRLEEEGFVVTVHGKGTYVAAADRQLALEARRKSVEDDFAAAVSKAAAVGLGREDILEIVEIILEDYPWS